MRGRCTLVLPLLAAPLLLAGAAPGAFPAGTGRILYASESSFGIELTTMNALGADRRSVAPANVRSAASMSPDGTRFAYTLTTSFAPIEEPDVEIVVGTFARSFRAVTQNASQEGRPAWTADGRGLLYSSDRDGDWDVWLADDLASQTPRNLTADSPAAERNPRASPDGRFVAFESDRDGNPEIYVMTTAGALVGNVSQSPARDTAPDWAPDSTRLVFASDRTGAGDLYVVAATGGTATRVVGSAGVDSHPAWSPDGSLIAFSSDRDGDDDVYVVAPDGSGERALTANASEDVVQDWQPLRDATPPFVRALASSGPRGRAAVVRFRLRENAAIATVTLELQYGGGRSGFGTSTLAGFRKVGADLYAYTIPRRFGPQPLPRAFAFCVEATDTSGNVADSCARWRAS